MEAGARGVVAGGELTLRGPEGREPTAFLTGNDLFKPEFLSGFLGPDSRTIFLNLVTQFPRIYETQK